MAPVRKFNCLCCSQQLVHVLCVKHGEMSEGTVFFGSCSRREEELHYPWCGKSGRWCILGQSHAVLLSSIYRAVQESKRK
uniref:Uncharacterized protein n=1 Tax=Aegilops tauschii subsp. strangulata TaxID=200361 RepID=A0A453F0H0_AEGTS